MNRFLKSCYGNVFNYDILKSLLKEDETTRDAFGKLRVSEPWTLLEISFIHDINDSQISRKVTNGGTIIRTLPYLILDSPINGTTIIQSRQRCSYQPGKSLLLLMTGILNYNNGISRLGYYDSLCGLFFEAIAGSLYCVKRKGGIDTRVLVNTNGLIDLSKVQIFWIDMTWLSVGSVRMGTYQNGKMEVLHTFKHTNLIEEPYMEYANLFVRYETIGDSTMMAICATVISEGGFNTLGRLLSIDNDITQKTINNTTMTPIIACRIKNGSITQAMIENFNLVTSTANSTIHTELYILRDTQTTLLTGVVWTSLEDTELYIEYSVSAMSIVVTTLSPKISTYLGRNDSGIDLKSSNYSNLILSMNVDNVADIAVLCGKSLGGTPSVLASMMLKQL